MMIDNQIKQNFPLLPFCVDLPYIVIQNDCYLKNVKEDLSCSNDTSESENENKQENKIFNNDYINLNSFNINHKKKSPVQMNEESSMFKFSFYQTFTSRKKFPKKYVVLIHNEISRELNLPRISRDESRSIDLYFSHYHKHAKEILLYIDEHKNDLIERIPELHSIYTQ